MSRGGEGGRCREAEARGAPKQARRGIARANARRELEARGEGGTHHRLRHRRSAARDLERLPRALARGCVDAPRVHPASARSRNPCRADEEPTRAARRPRRRLFRPRCSHLARRFGAPGRHTFHRAPRAFVVMASSGWVEDAKGALDALADVVDGELAGDAPRVLAAHHPTARWYAVGPDGTLSSGLVADASARPFARVDRAAPPASIPAHARRMNRVVETGRLEGAPGTPQNGVLVWARCETCVPASDDDAPGGPPRLEHASLLLVLFKCPEGWRVISHVREARDVTDRAGGFGPDVPPPPLSATTRATRRRAPTTRARARWARWRTISDSDTPPTRTRCRDATTRARGSPRPRRIWTRRAPRRVTRGCS